MALVAAASRIRLYAGFVKLEHSVFSLPLVFAGALLGARRLPSLRVTGWLLLAAVAARTVGMGLNRLIDAAIDARNPRTQRRELPRGAMTRAEAWAVVLLAGIVYVVAAAAIAPVCLQLSPIPVILFAVYPYLKRFTALAHLGLGIAWSLAPVAGWLAVTQSLNRLGETVWLWLFCILWVTGFDIIYATMDEAFDRKEGLHSLPAQMGKRGALRVVAVLHLLAWLALDLMWVKQLHGNAAVAWLVMIGLLFVWQQLIAERRPEFAFFKLNGAIGFLVLGLVWSGI